MTTDETKDEALRVLGPDMGLVTGMQKKGYHVYDWEAGQKVTLKFLCGAAVGARNVEMELRILGEEAKLTLEQWGAGMVGGNFDCWALFSRWPSPGLICLK